MRILATDLDRTLLPNGSWKPDENAIEMFNKLVENNNVRLVYVTGRNLNLTETAIKEYGIRYPHFLCGDVGSSIREYQNGQWIFDQDWIHHVKKTSPKWDRSQIDKALSNIQGLRTQEKEHLNEFKQSYYMDISQKDRILKTIDQLIKGRFDEVIINSFDSKDNKELVDIMPASATKETALEFVVEKFGTSKDEVVFCGDSGNDIAPLTGGFQGVLVRNADEQLVDSVKKALDKNPSLKVYFAKGNFKGLSGYYTSGVIEGAYHYGVFKD